MTVKKKTKGRIAGTFTNLRFWAFWVLAASIVIWFWRTDPDNGRETLMRLQHLAWVLVVLLPIYIARRSLVDGRMGQAYRVAIRTPLGAALVYLGIAIVTAALIIVMCGRAAVAAELPPRALESLPVLDAQISSVWPQAPLRSVYGALVDKETCRSRTHPHCWSPRAELKTSREYGFGLGQLTVAYRTDGSERFNAWREVRDQDLELARWQWADRYNTRLQLRALVVMNRGCFMRLRPLVLDDFNALAMCDAGYNGGVGGVLTERRMCAAVPGCDPRVWFGNVELHSAKSREKWRGYGASAFEINRGHVEAVMVSRRPPYARWWREQG